MADKKLNPAAVIEGKRLEANQADIKSLRDHIKKSNFAWSERYNKKYILKFARDYEFNSSRLQRAIDSIDFKNRGRINRELNKEKH